MKSLLVLLIAFVAQGQSFEAASIRRNLSGGTNTHINSTGGRYSVENASLKTLIRNAYTLLGFQLTGGPAWLDTEMYDITATTGGAEIPPEDLKLLLQNLLAERFGLKVHWETREGTVYALLLDKGGPKITISTDGSSGVNTSKGRGRGQMKGTHERVALLASNLANQLGRFVIDKTGLDGFYDWLLIWDPDPTAESTNPSIFTAVRQQLGLRLESQKGPMQMLVIDRAEHASEN